MEPGTEASLPLGFFFLSVAAFDGKKATIFKCTTIDNLEILTSTRLMEFIGQSTKIKRSTEEKTWRTLEGNSRCWGQHLKAYALRKLHNREKKQTTN